jgi:hypothetical protein
MLRYLGCSRAATHGVERAYMSAALYCLEHMESKSAVRTLRRIFRLWLKRRSTDFRAPAATTT